MLEQDKITDDVLAQIVRTTDPEFYKDWSDEKIIQASLQKRPELLKKVRMRTPGEVAYQKYGSKAAPNFIEQVAQQTKTQFRTMKAGLAGMTSSDTEVGENARRMADLLYKQDIRNNRDLQALMAWKEDEPGWSGLYAHLLKLCLLLVLVLALVF